jgi:hypothetical protein
LFQSCGGIRRDSSQSSRNEVIATEVHAFTTERKTFDHLITTTGKLKALSEGKALVEQEDYLEKLYILEEQFLQ